MTGGTTSSISRLTELIYKLKIRQIVIILLFSIAVVIYIFSFWGEDPNSPEWVRFFTRRPFPALADALLGSAIIGFAFEWYARQESDAILENLINSKLDTQKIAILSGIPENLLLRKDVQREILKNAKVEEILLNALQVTLNDDNIGEAFYNGYVRKTILYPERAYNYRFEIILEDILDPSLTDDIRRDYFDTIVKVSYETRLSQTNFRFAVATSGAEYNELLRKPEYLLGWWLEPSKSFPKPSEDNFSLLSFTVNNMPIASQVSKSTARYELECHDQSLTQLIGKSVNISYTFKVKTEKLAHAICTAVTMPTYDTTVSIDFAKASIAWIDAYDYYVSENDSVIQHIPSKTNPRQIIVRLREWVFPKGGVVFVWSLKEETSIFKSFEP